MILQANTYTIARILSSLVILVILVAIPFSLRPYAIFGSSMFPTLKTRELVLVGTLSIRFMDPVRGELLVFRNPHRQTEDGHVQIDIKRVVGLPGETVHVRDEKVVIDRACSSDGTPKKPQYADEQAQDGPCQSTYPRNTLLGGGSNGKNGYNFDMYLGPKDYFVLGDNRSNSSDSRSFGAVQAENFIGRAVLRMLPFSRLTVFTSVTQ